jgi:hypothetical protein
MTREVVLAVVDLADHAATERRDRIGDPGRQCSDAVDLAENPGGGVRRHADDLVQRQTEEQELRHRRGEIEHRTVQVVDVQVARDGAGGEPLGQRSPGHREGEAAHAVADVEDDAAGCCLAGLGSDAAVLVEQALLPSMETMRHDVAAPELAENLVQGHEREPRRFRRLQRRRQGKAAVGADLLPR